MNHAGDHIDSDISCLPQHFKTSTVRDLAWALNPRFDLVEQLDAYDRFVLTDAALATLPHWLHKLDHQAPTAVADLADHKQRLGYYFENLLAFLFDQGPGHPWRLLARNHRIYGGATATPSATTLGELDFLLQSPSQTIHLEVAVKFYLGFRGSDTIQWLGPNSRDSLDKKLAKMANRQLALSRHPNFIRDTQNLAVKHAITPAFWVKGLLFHPWRDPLPLPANVYHNGNQFNVWLHVNQVAAFFAESPLSWYSLNKYEWLTGGLREAPELSTYASLGRHFKQNRKPLMLCALENRDRRVFVVGDDWPNTSSGF